MKATDARRHSPEKLEVLRELGFAMRREGFRAVEIAQALGVVRGIVYKWFRNAAASTEEQATTGGKRGRPKGVGTKLTKQQEVQIRQQIIDKNPKQLKFDFALWTRRAVQALIKRECQVELSMTAVGVYLRSWGLTSSARLKVRLSKTTSECRNGSSRSIPQLPSEPRLRTPSSTGQTKQL